MELIFSKLFWLILTCSSAVSHSFYFLNFKPIFFSYFYKINMFLIKKGVLYLNHAHHPSSLLISLSKPSIFFTDFRSTQIRGRIGLLGTPSQAREEDRPSGEHGECRRAQYKSLAILAEHICWKQCGSALHDGGV